MENKINKPRFLLKTFLVADIKVKMILRIFFLKISNANLLFEEKLLT